MLVKEKEIKVGEVYLEQEVIISDPCYSNSSLYYKGSLDFQGMYNCYYTEVDGRVASILVILSNYSYNEVTVSEVSKCSVDSGQLGIFNSSSYRKSISKEVFNSTLNREFPYESWKRKWEDQKTSSDKFYSACGNITLSSNRVGILENIGIVSSSGYGDGYYPVYKLENKEGTVVGYKVSFIE